MDRYSKAVADGDRGGVRLHSRGGDGAELISMLDPKNAAAARAWIEASAAANRERGLLASFELAAGIFAVAIIIFWPGSALETLGVLGICAVLVGGGGVLEARSRQRKYDDDLHRLREHESH